MEFDEFWSLYPKRVARGQCEKKYSKLTKADKQMIGETLPERVKTDSVWREGTFIPLPMTYLNQGRFLDEEWPGKPKPETFHRQSRVSNWCDTCRSIVHSQRHKDICVDRGPYFDFMAGGDKYVLKSSGVKKI
tara:strand:+ start:553 stop:951 length:399 start_codon:yes stop_codon:yes gene_type:complete